MKFNWKNISFGGKKLCFHNIIYICLLFLLLLGYININWLVLLRCWVTPETSLIRLPANTIFNALFMLHVEFNHLRQIILSFIIFIDFLFVTILLSYLAWQKILSLEYLYLWPFFLFLVIRSFMYPFIISRIATQPRLWKMINDSNPLFLY